MVAELISAGVMQWSTTWGQQGLSHQKPHERLREAPGGRVPVVRWWCFHRVICVELQCEESDRGRILKFQL